MYVPRAALVLSLVLASSPVVRAETVYDLVVYGLTSAGVAASVQARRMGRTVVLVGPEQHLGGLSSGGLGWTDSGHKEVVGGIAREFYHGVWLHYQDDSAWKWQSRSAHGGRGQGAPAVDGDQRTMWVFEPHVAEAIFAQLVRESRIPVHRDQWLDRERGVVKTDGRITSIAMLGGQVYRGRMFLDATYEGDLLAAAGVSYTVGRESNRTYGETLNGVQTRRARSHQFQQPIDPYRVPGDPSSGLLPRIHAGDPGEEGSGDKRLQAYNYRVCLTRVEENRVPFPRPEGYDPGQYELLLRNLQAGSRHVFGKFDPIPNAKTDTNNHGSFSTDNIGMNYDYPEASYERRREILQEHARYQQGYFYFLANDPRVPEEVRRAMSGWGLARDEFLDNGHWPHQIYVREARRMVSDFVITENHVTRRAPTPRPAGMGSYNMDSHHVQRYVDAQGHARNEGDIQVSPGGPYPIDFGALLPRQGECENLLVPVCVSCSHIAYGSIRMEPVFMILGQSAATAACQALDQGVPVQEVAYERLRARLLADGQVLEYQRGAGPGAVGVDPARLKGIVVDDGQAERAGPWQVSTSLGPFVGRGYLHEGHARTDKAEARFVAQLPAPGPYEVRLAYTASSNRASNTLVTIRHAGGSDARTVDQRIPPPLDGMFLSLGRFEFDARAEIIVSNRSADGHVIVDAVQLLPAR